MRDGAFFILFVSFILIFNFQAWGLNSSLRNIVRELKRLRHTLRKEESEESVKSEETNV